MSVLGKQPRRLADRPPAEMVGSGLIRLRVNDLDITACTSKEAKAAIDRLRSVKKQLLADKKAVNRRMAELRAASRNEQRRQGTLVLEGEASGGASPRDASDLVVSKRLNALGQDRTSLVRQLRTIDSGIAQLEAFILANAIEDHRVLTERMELAIGEAGGIP